MLHRPYALGALMLLWLTTGCLSAWAKEPPSYLWADADGVTHVSEKLGDVPEPFASIYRAQVGYVGPLAGAGRATGLERERDAWRKRLEAARSALMAATQKLRGLQQAVPQQEVNPILRLLPMAQAAEEARKKQQPALEEATQNYLEARRALLVRLPCEARLANVPPGWVQ